VKLIFKFLKRLLFADYASLGLTNILMQAKSALLAAEDDHKEYLKKCEQELKDLDEEIIE